MSVIGYAWWLSSLVVRLLVDYWPITLALLIATYVSISRGGLPEDQQLRSLPSVLFLFPILILLWGAIAHIEFGIRPAIPWRIAVLVVVVLLHCAMSVSVVYISRGYRRQTAWLVGLISWVAIACLIQSSLALTGRLDPPI
jgi:hypothetical protein